MKRLFWRCASASAYCAMSSISAGRRIGLGSKRERQQFALGVFEQVVDQRELVVGAALDRLQLRRRRSQVALQHAHVADDGGQRRAQVVADVGHEPRLFARALFGLLERGVERARLARHFVVQPLLFVCLPLHQRALVRSRRWCERWCVHGRQRHQPDQQARKTERVGIEARHCVRRHGEFA
jgi:hypothetical protein